MPSRSIDAYLFGNSGPWSGEKIYRLAGAGERLDPQSAARRGADVDIDPGPRAAFSDGRPVPLNATEADVARILLRYRLYTYQPDEMITMMALAGMRPSEFDFDPKLYQYGGLFLYPVGALIRLCGTLGLIDVRGDVTYYLDHPDEFGKFYVVARLYAAAWGLLGVFIVHGIARRLGGPRPGAIAAALFALLPVVVCMSHEGKPHLPGAVLMLSAVWFAIRYLDRSRTDANWWLMCVCCGAAFGMVLSSLPIFVLIPLTAWMEVSATSLGARSREAAPDADGVDSALGQEIAAQENARNHSFRNPQSAIRNRRAGMRYFIQRTMGGVAVASAAYLVTNPYILINTLVNRDVLRSNFGNSLAMYEMARIGEGFVRVLELTVEGATMPVLALGALALLIGLIRRNAAVLPLAVPAGVFFLQFVLIGAGKPGEYGRFGIFPDAALAIATACLLGGTWVPKRGWLNGLAAAVLLGVVTLSSVPYWQGFLADALGRGTRSALAASVRDWLRECQSTGACSDERPLEIVVVADPAPYSLPPIPFAGVRVLESVSVDAARPYAAEQPQRRALIVPMDRPPQDFTGAETAGIATLISWANKPFLVIPPRGLEPVDAAPGPP